MARKSSAADSDTRVSTSKRGVILILAGLVVTGLAAGYAWLRQLPK